MTVADPKDEAEADAVHRAAVLLSTGIREATVEVGAKSTTSEQRAKSMEALRIFLRVEKGIPEPDGDGYARVLALNVEAWIKQARKEGYDAEWLRRHCMTVDRRFTKLGLDEYEMALLGVDKVGAKPKRGPRPSLKAACRILNMAQIHPDDTCLAKGAANLKTDSKCAGAWTE